MLRKSVVISIPRTSSEVQVQTNVESPGYRAGYATRRRPADPRGRLADQRSYQKGLPQSRYRHQVAHSITFIGPCPCAWANFLWKVAAPGGIARRDHVRRRRARVRVSTSPRPAPTSSEMTHQTRIRGAGRCVLSIICVCPAAVRSNMNVQVTNVCLQLLAMLFRSSRQHAKLRQPFRIFDQFMF